MAAPQSGDPQPNHLEEDVSFASMAKELEALANWQGSMVDFWGRYAALTGGLCRASVMVIAFKPAAEASGWKRLTQWETTAENSQQKALFRGQIAKHVDHCSREGSLLRALHQAESHVDSQAESQVEPLDYVMGLTLPLRQTRDTFVALVLLEACSLERAREAQLRLQIVAEIPNQLLLRQTASKAQGDTLKVANTLDLVGKVSQESQFVPAVMTFCNALAARFQCDRVSLGWLKGDGIKLRAMSHTERFDRKMEVIQLLEAAMEESLDQDDTILHPTTEIHGPLGRDHAQYARSSDLPHLCSIPLHQGDTIVGVVTFERLARPFDPAEVPSMQLPCELLSYRLRDLKRQDRWLGARVTDALGDLGGKLVGPQHTLSKLLAILVLAGVLMMLLIRVPYRVEANFILKSDEVFYQSVPFDSYIKEVFLESGDNVAKGDPLLKLDTDNLELELSSVTADLNRFKREAEKARAARALADMRVSEALVAQQQARLELVQWRIGQATLRSPMDGIMVEGDLKERLGAPVNEGEVLFRIARIDRLYVEAEANERDIDDVLMASEGEIAFLSQPERKYPIRINRVEPSAVSKTSENVFLIRTEFLESPETWFRPGMSGVAKLDVGRRSLFYIFTHRTIDFLRMFFWW